MIKKSLTVSKFGIKGRVCCQVIGADDKVRIDTGFARNLWLDQGMDNIAEFPICQLFEVAAKGSGNDPTNENISATDDFRILVNTSVVERTAGAARDFVAGDIGKLIRLTNGTDVYEGRILGITDIDNAEVDTEASVTVVANDTGEAKLFHVNQTGLETEVGRTSTYGQNSQDNRTVTTFADGERVFKRTFLFGTEDFEIEKIEGTYTQVGTGVERITGTRDFTADDVGKTLIFSDLDEYVITSFTSATEVEVDTDDNKEELSITLKEEVLKEDVADTNTYNLDTAGVVTRTAGARDFVVGDVGKIIYFDTADVEGTITAVNSVSEAEIDLTGETLTGDTITIYGFQTYEEVGFSHLEERGDNLNVRFKLGSPVNVYRSTPLTPSERLKVIYEVTLTVTPYQQSSPTTLAGVVSGQAALGNTTGRYALENFATSIILASGITDLSFVHLEPYEPGYLGLSSDSRDIKPIEGLDSPADGRVRSENLSFTPLEAEEYEEGSFQRLYTGEFDVTEAVATNWRSLMLTEPESGAPAYTYLFTVGNITKQSGYVLRITFRKAWSQDLGA